MATLRRTYPGIITAGAALYIVLVVGVLLAAGIGHLLPESAELVYTRRDALFGQDIYLMDVERTLAKRLTHHEGENYSPAWSPDGEILAFISTRSGYDELFVMDVEDGTLTPYAPRYVPYSAPAWSPDGTRIAFRTYVLGSPKIAVLHIDSGETYIVNNSGSSDSPALWSPDGNWLLFVSFRDGNPRLYVVSPECEEGCAYNERLLLDSVMALWPPAWSPDGSQLAFASVSFQGMRLYSARMTCFDLGGNCLGELKRVTEGVSDYYFPTWSPDGEHIAFLDKTDDVTDIYLVEDGEIRQLTVGNVNLKGVTWSPDGEQIAFEIWRGGRVDVALVTVTTGDVRYLTAGGLANIDPAWRPKNSR
ncbi:MAG: hypothetical protein K8L97_32180 [Anaerolineae bacterium]|nr:hypothetical protein [Anaerolineae bacterium]